ncbi:MAG: 3-deoxy-manno-octulosonate cytidylyltransferase [Nitrospirae bacterium]|nr:MAG: 3-deoxy-manno-octulosonate cytidylyltransferase [Nitrospirota bacterium]
MLFNRSSVAVLIPARYESTRFPGKVLVSIDDKPMIQHIYEAARQSPYVSTVRVVTDDARIETAVRNFDGAVSVVDRPCRTGSDRVAAAIQDLDEEIVVNWQADEIPRDPGLLDDLIRPFLADPSAQMGTLMRKAQPSDNPSDPSVVKVVTDRRSRALYFSRAPIPYVRDRPTGSQRGDYWLHLGLYIFRRETLLRFAELPTGTWEAAEQLEQLRALEFGIPVHVWETHVQSVRIDTPDDLIHANR